MRVVELDRELLGEALHRQCAASRRMRNMSCSEQVTKKYCCSSRSSLPCSCSSFGYSTLLMFSEATLRITAPWWSPRLKVENRRTPAPRSSTGAACWRCCCDSRGWACRRARRSLPSAGTQRTRNRSVLIAVALGVAARTSPRRPTRAAAISHGLPKRSQLSVRLLLPAVDDLLVEDAELVADAVAQAGQFQRRHANR